MQRTGRDGTLVTGGGRPANSLSVRSWWRRGVHRSFGPKKRALRMTTVLRSRDVRDGAFGADDQGSAFGVGADGIELDAGLFLGADAARVVRGTEVEDEVVADEEKAFGKECRLDGFLPIELCGRQRINNPWAAAVVDYGGEIRLRMNGGECPGFAAVFGEG